MGVELSVAYLYGDLVPGTFLRVPPRLRTARDRLLGDKNLTTPSVTFSYGATRTMYESRLILNRSAMAWPRRKRGSNSVCLAIAKGKHMYAFHDNETAQGHVQTSRVVTSRESICTKYVGDDRLRTGRH